MRPVTKGDQAPYKYVVDVSSQVNLDYSLDAITIDFTKAHKDTKIKIMGIWRTLKPTAYQVLDDLLTIAKDEARGVPPTKKAKTDGPTLREQVENIKQNLDTKLSDMYAPASGVLVGQLGRFCSFCELYVSGPPAVEHVAPKTPYPLFYLAWDNFLLACPVCNSAKGDKPPRNDAQLGVPNPSPKEVDYYEWIKRNYLWPQEYVEVYQRTKPWLAYQDTTSGKWKKVTYPVSPGTVVTCSDEMTRTLKANVLIDKPVVGEVRIPREWQLDVPVMVVVVPIGRQGTNMVDLVNLNKPTGSDKKPGGEADIRMWERTQQWFKVLTALTKLKDARDEQEFDNLWTMMMIWVSKPGLYSVWVTVLDLLGRNRSWPVPGTNPPVSVMEKFLTEIVDKKIFPGTDITDAP